MPIITTPNTGPNTGIEICYEDHGSPEHEVILLVMGLGAQLTLWPDDFVETLVSHSFRVIRYDNRDIGLSQKMEGARAPSLPIQVLRKKIGWPAKVPYTLTDMAHDGIGVLDALGIEAAHVVGASMGGMIAQLMAVHHGPRLRSLTSIMSTTGNSKLPQADKHAMDALMEPMTSTDEESLVERGLNVAKHIGSPGFPFDAERQRERVLRSIRRSVYPPGLSRQLAAIIDDGCRRTRLADVRVPTLVLHGEDDPLVKLEAGEDTARSIPGARLVTIPGWGHDIPDELIAWVASEIVTHARSG